MLLYIIASDTYINMSTPELDGPELPLSWQNRIKMSKVDLFPTDYNEPQLGSQWPPLHQRIQNHRELTFSRPSTAFRSVYVETEAVMIEQFPAGWSSIVDGTASMAIIPTAPTASSRVFEITELLEQILLHLSFKDLLLSQRVARKWEAVTTQSATLQRHLFFQPMSARYAWLYDHRHTRGIAGNKRKDLPLNGFARKVSLDYELSGSEIGYCNLKVSAYLHPLYESVRSGLEGLITMGRLRRSKKNGKFRPSCKSDTEASWRKMFWCQPPVTQFGVHWYSHPKMFYIPKKGEDFDSWCKWRKSEEFEKENSFDFDVDGEEILDIDSDAYNDDTDDQRHVREIFGEGYLTVGEVVDMMEEWEETTMMPFERGLGLVSVRNSVFPSMQQARQNVIWEKEDDWYYKALAEKDERWYEASPAVVMKSKQV